MSTYEYTDRNGRKLRTSMNARSEVCVQSVGATDAVTVVVPTEDAPAVALAILEAAGHRPAAWQDLSSLTADERLQLSMYHLKQSEARRARDKERAEQAEREAEDAKVREFFLALNPGNFIAADVEVDDRVREQYRAARNYFAKEGQS